MSSQAKKCAVRQEQTLRAADQSGASRLCCCIFVLKASALLSFPRHSHRFFSFSSAAVPVRLSCPIDRRAIVWRSTSLRRHSGLNRGLALVHHHLVAFAASPHQPLTREPRAHAPSNGLGAADGSRTRKLQQHTAASTEACPTTAISDLPWPPSHAPLGRRGLRHLNLSLSPTPTAVIA